ncbi:hypothetical protein BGZ99_000457 [Dissophora globulifera]|uniref:UV-stimulated scaffold protein A C-terminal domain-containing protein n=1 Tax=Dissophora globulifera TaxID=979702 RepID=A0A9P6UY93_9FUNG|nr:hypothetical protein BGZ99_000457 [Dissophora globulifera]
MALDLQGRESLSALILATTKTGDLYLDPAQVKEVKSICKKSDTNVKIAYELLMIQLQRKHSQIRYSSTQLIAELFQRSHVFRDLLVADYSIFLQLTVGIHQNTLPPPVLFADKTKQLAISLTNEWNAKYGAVYRQIALGYEFLKYHLKVDFTNLVPVTEEARSAEQRSQEELSRRLRQKRYEKAAVEIDEQTEDIQDNFRKMNSCFDILVPKLDDDAALNSIFSAAADTEEDDEARVDQEEGDQDGGEGEDSADVNETVSRHDPIGVYDNALGSNRYKLTINVSKENPVDVEESDDNSELFITLRECYRLIVKKHWPLVMEWLDVLMKADHESGPQRAEYDRLLRMTIDLKKGIADAKGKCEDLGVNMDTMYGPDEHDSDGDDDEFEEVDVLSPRNKGKQVQRNIPQPEPRKPRNPVFLMQGEAILKDDPTYIGGTKVFRSKEVPALEPKDVSSVNNSKTPSAGSPAPMDQNDSEESRAELLARAPLVPWDDDLAVWDKKEMAFNTSGLEYSHRFLGVGDGSNLVSQATLDRMKMRTSLYNPQLPEVIKACRYPMSNGRLCMRRDLERCPYHGPIVPRDKHGQTQEEGGFIPDEETLDDEQEAALIQRAVAAASGSSSSSSAGRTTRSLRTQLPKDSSTWEDIEEDVNMALGLETIQPRRKRGQAGQEGGIRKSKRKGAQKPPSALVNLSKPPDSSRVRLLRHLGSKNSKDSVEQDRRSERADLTRDSKMHQW